MTVTRSEAKWQRLQAATQLAITMACHYRLDQLEEAIANGRSYIASCKDDHLADVARGAVAMLEVALHGLSS